MPYVLFKENIINFPQPNICPLKKWTKLTRLCSDQGRRHEVRLETDSDWRGRIQVNRNRLPPNSDFSSKSAHFYFENIEKSENFGKSPENVL